MGIDRKSVLERLPFWWKSDILSLNQIDEGSMQLTDMLKKVSDADQASQYVQEYLDEKKSISREYLLGTKILKSIDKIWRKDNPNTVYSKIKGRIKNVMKDWLIYSNGREKTLDTYLRTETDTTKAANAIDAWITEVDQEFSAGINDVVDCSEFTKAEKSLIRKYATEGSMNQFAAALKNAQVNDDIARGLIEQKQFRDRYVNQLSKTTRKIRKSEKKHWGKYAVLGGVGLMGAAIAMVSEENSINQQVYTNMDLIAKSVAGKESTLEALLHIKNLGKVTVENGANGLWGIVREVSDFLCRSPTDATVYELVNDVATDNEKMSQLAWNHFNPGNAYPGDNFVKPVSDNPHYLEPGMELNLSAIVNHYTGKCAQGIDSCIKDTKDQLQLVSMYLESVKGQLVNYKPIAAVIGAVGFVAATTGAFFGFGKKRKAPDLQNFFIQDNYIGHMKNIPEKLTTQTTDKIARHQKLYDMLQNDSVSAKYAAEKLGVSTTTIYKDRRDINEYMNESLIFTGKPDKKQFSFRKLMHPI